MRKIGLISDTHGFLDQNVFKHFDAVDEVWHAGDIGEGYVIEQLKSHNTLKVVYGNIETPAMQKNLPEYIIEQVDELKFMMIHIAGRPGRYAKGISTLLKKHQPDVLICGHSHILRVERDPKYGLIYINPGAAGHQGFHKKRTILRFGVLKDQLVEMEVIELGLRGRA